MDPSSLSSLVSHLLTQGSEACAVANFTLVSPDVLFTLAVCTRPRVLDRLRALYKLDYTTRQVIGDLGAHFSTRLELWIVSESRSSSPLEPSQIWEPAQILFLWSCGHP